MKHPRRRSTRQWLLPLEYESNIVFSEATRTEAIRTLADLLLEAVGHRDGGTKGGANDEPEDQA